jgi:type I restriction enzyme S subunit
MSSDFSILSDNDDLPIGWAYCTVGDTGEYINGCAFKPTDWGEIGKPIIRIQNLTDLDKSFNRTTRQVEEKYNVCDGDILVSWSATLDCFIWSRGEALLNQHIFKVVPNHLVVKNFLFHLLRNAIQEMKQSEHLHGSTMKHINREPFMSHKIALPPLNEQRRIVEKVEALMARSRRAKEALDAIPKLIEQFRQSVLAAAFRGDLTADWREQNPNIEPASVLLERIRKERREKWEQTELEKMRAKGKEPLTDEWKKKYKEPEAIDDSELPELPDGWSWITVENIADIGTGATPLRSEAKYYENATIPWVTSGALNNLFVETSEECITTTATQETNAKVFPKHTLLIAMYGEGKTRGKVSELLIEAATNQACAAIVMNGLSSQIRSIVKLFFQKNYADIRKLASGGVQPNLNLSMIKSTFVPIPPFEEQKQILLIVESCMASIDVIEKQYYDSSVEVDNLNQSILSKAFRGELVEQDPNDEPASVLLERIQKEREKEKAKVKQTGAKKLRK